MKRLLFFHKDLKDLDSVKNEVGRIIAKQKSGSPYDLSSFKITIEELLNSISEFNPDNVITYHENVVLPETKHDLELVIKMLNYMREQKKLRRANMPLFIHPDEILLAYREGKISFSGGDIQTQMAIVFQKGSIMLIGFVYGRDYVIISN